MLNRPPQVAGSDSVSSKLLGAALPPQAAAVKSSSSSSLGQLESGARLTLQSLQHLPPRMIAKG